MAKQNTDRVTPDLFVESRPGRPRTSVLTRKDQMKTAQQRRRQKLTEEGRKRVTFWLTPETIEHLVAYQTHHGFKSQTDAFEEAFTKLVDLLKFKTKLT